METKKELTSQERIEKIYQALKEARKMQQDWMHYGLDFVHLYIEDVDGDWLEKWGKDEENLENEALATQIAAEPNFASGSFIESGTTFLKSDDQVAVRVRKVLGTRSIPEVVIRLELIYRTYTEDKWRYAAGDVLAGSEQTDETEQDIEDAETELQNLAESLLKKLAKIWGNHN